MERDPWNLIRAFSKSPCLEQAKPLSVKDCPVYWEKQS